MVHSLPESCEMKRPHLLFIALSFPPVESVACIRAANIVKRLARDYGWRVSVITCALDSSELLCTEANDETIGGESVQIMRVGNRWTPRLAAGALAGVSDDSRFGLGTVARHFARRVGVSRWTGWYLAAARASRDLRRGDVDVIMATGGPFGTFWVADRLSSRLSCPFVLDYRDLWSGNPHHSYFHRSRRREARLFKRSAGVFVVSPSMEKWLAGSFGEEAKIRVVPNGYDPEELSIIEPMAFDHFAIVYAGRFYPPKRTIMPVMQGLRRAVDGGNENDWLFHYYGPQGDLVRAAAREVALENRVVDHGLVRRDQALSAIKGAGCAIVVTSVMDSGCEADRGIVTGKVFEALGLGVPLLVIAPPGSDVEAVVQTASRGAVFSGSDREGIARFLTDLMYGHVEQRVRTDNYAWPVIMAKVDSALRKIAGL